MLITAAEASEISAAGFAALKCSSVTELQSEAMTLLDRLIGSSVVMFMLDPEQCDSADRRVVFRGVDSNHQKIYQSRFHKNPYAEWARKMKSRWNGPVMLPSAKNEQVLASPFYQEFMRPTGMHFMMAIGLVRENRYVGLVGVARPEHDREFNEHEVAKASLLAPALQGALERLLLNEKLQEAAWVADALESDGVAVLDSSLKIKYSNSTGGEILTRLQGPKEWHGVRNPADLPSLLQEPCASFAAGAQPGQSTDFEIDTPRAGYSVRINLRQLPTNAARAGYVLSFLPSTPTMSAHDQLRKLGLTPREIDIVHAVGSGLTSYQMADKLCISFFTVQSHLKSIYQKLDVRNRVGLLGVVARTLR